MTPILKRAGHFDRIGHAPDHVARFRADRHHFLLLDLDRDNGRFFDQNLAGSARRVVMVPRSIPRSFENIATA